MRMIEGQLIARDVRIVILAARFNELIVRNLVEGAVDALRRHGVGDADIHVVRVPGAFELPLAAQRLAKLRRYDGIAALGRGDPWPDAALRFRLPANALPASAAWASSTACQSASAY